MRPMQFRQLARRIITHVRRTGLDDVRVRSIKRLASAVGVDVDGGAGCARVPENEGQGHSMTYLFLRAPMPLSDLSHPWCPSRNTWLKSWSGSVAANL